MIFSCVYDITVAPHMVDDNKNIVDVIDFFIKFLFLEFFFGSLLQNSLLQNESSSNQ